MKRKVLSGCVSFIALGAIFTTNLKAQNFKNIEPHERMGVLWSNALEHIRVKYHSSIKEFQVFERFETNPIHLLRASVQAEAHKENYDLSLLRGTATEAENKLDVLYQQYLTTEKQFPTSVDEFRRRLVDSLVNPCDSSGCTNMNFSEGTLNTWYGYYAENVSVSSFDITGLTGGLLGSVTEAANDPNTMAYENADCSRSLVNDYQISLTSGGYDYLVPTIPRVSPWATGGHSVMLGDSIFVGSGVAILSKTFYVTSVTSALTYQYAVFLANPSHAAAQQPFFNVSVLDENGDTITDCGRYNVISGVSTIGFDTIPSFSECSEAFPVYYRPWTIVNVPLKAYVGQCVTIEFEVADCEPGGHFGYAYVDCSCSPAGVITSSPALCPPDDSLELTAPPGAQSYAWTGPAGGILTDTTQQSVWVQDSGTYTVITIPVTGAACSDTITIHIPKLPGPPPTPSFKADTVCAGQPTQFINTSDSANGTFSWDFYNIGVYNYTDTNNFNPTWTYVNPGKYVVKLNEVLNGCGSSVYDTIIVDTNVINPTFTATPTCLGDTTYFTPRAAGASKWNWNFGDPISGTSDSSTLSNPGHLFTSAGTYTVVLNANNRGNCGARDSQVVTIYTFPTPVITGLDTICSPGSDALSVTGGTTYVWNPGAHAGSTYTVSPTATTTYTVTATNGTCSGTATFPVYVFSSAVVTITPSRNPTCPGDTLTLRSAGGAGIGYRWSTGSNASSIVVNPTTVTTYTLYESLGPCTDSSTVIINIISSTTDTLTKNIDSVCPGSPVILTATASGGTSPYTYSWSNGGTSSSITVSDTATTTYTATVEGTCNSVIKTITAVVIQVPKAVISGKSWTCKSSRDTLTVTSSTNPTTYRWNNGSTNTTYITGDVYADSLVYVIASNSLGCTDSVAFPITVRTAPTISFTTPPKSCTGAPVEIVPNITGTGPYTYSWSTGETTDSISVASPPDSTATTYTLTISNGCTYSRTISISAEFPTLNTITTQTVTLINDTLSPSYVTLWANGNSTVYYWQDSILVTCINPTICDTVRVSPTVTTTYTVTGFDKAGCQVTGYVTVEVAVPCFDYKVPNVFTPNFAGPGGKDDKFYIETENIDGWSIDIYDRWGKQVYSSTDRDQYWDGTNKSGDKVADGVYYYVITGVCKDNTYKKTGFVQLIR